MKSKQSTCAVLGMAVFLAFSFFLTGCGGGSEEETSIKKVKVDWQDKLEEKIKFEMPAHLTLVSAAVTDTFDQSAGGYQMTEFKFTATVKTNVDLYNGRLERDNRNQVRLAELLIAKGSTATVEGKGMHSQDMFNVNLPYKAFDKLGVERSVIESEAGGATLLVKGSEEEKAFYAAIENEKREQEATRQAEIDARKAEREAQEQAQLAEIKSRQEAREAEKKALEDAKMAKLQSAMEGLRQVYAANGVVHITRADATSQNDNTIYSITDIETSGDAYTWTAVLHNPAAPGRSVCQLVWSLNKRFADRVDLEMLPVSVAWGNGALDKAWSFQWNPEERNFTNSYSNKVRYILPLNAADQKLAQDSVDGLLQPWGKTEIDPNKQAIVDGSLVDLASGRILASVGNQNLTPSELAAGAFVDASGRHFYPSAYRVHNARAVIITEGSPIPKPSNSRNEEGFRLAVADTSFRVYEKGGDFYVREAGDGFSEYRRLTDFGIFGSASNSSFIVGEFLYVFASNPKVRIHLKSGELVEVDNLPKSPAFLVERPGILDRYNAVLKDDILFLYDYAEGKELRLDADVSLGGPAHHIAGSFGKYDGKFHPKSADLISEGVYFLRADKAVVDFKSMTAYGLRDTAKGNIPANLVNEKNDYGVGLNLEKVSPSGRYVLLRGTDKKNFDPKKGGVKFYLLDITDGSLVRELDGEIDRIYRAGSRPAWVSENRFLVYITGGDLNQIGLWSLDFIEGEAKKIFTRFKDIRDVAYSSEQDRLYLLTDSAGDKGLVAVNLETGEQSEYPEVEGRSRVIALRSVMPKVHSISVVGKRLTDVGLATTAESFEVDYGARGRYHPAIAAMIFNDKKFGKMIQNPADGFDFVRAVDAVIDYLFGEQALRRNAVVYQQIIAKTPDLEVYLREGKKLEQVREFHKKAYEEMLNSLALKRELPMSLSKGLAGDQLQKAIETVEATLAGGKGGMDYPQHSDPYRWVTNWRLGGFDKKLAYDANRLRDIYLTEGRKRYHASMNPKVVGEEDDFAPFYARKMTSALLNDSWWPADKPASRKAVDGDYYLNAYRRKVVQDWNAYGASNATLAAQTPAVADNTSGSGTSVAEPNKQAPAIQGSGNQSPQTELGKKVKEVGEGVDAAKKVIKNFGGFFD